MSRVIEKNIDENKKKGKARTSGVKVDQRWLGDSYDIWKD